MDDTADEKNNTHLAQQDGHYGQSILTLVRAISVAQYRMKFQKEIHYFVILSLEECLNTMFITNNMVNRDSSMSIGVSTSIQLQNLCCSFALIFCILVGVIPISMDLKIHNMSFNLKI